MKKLNLLFKVVLSFLVLQISAEMYAQTACFFSTQTSGYPTSFVFDSGDKMYIATGKNTNASNTCPGSTGETRPYRLQENTFVLELVSTSLDSISIYGNAGSTNERNFSKIEVSTESKDGPFTEITSQALIGNAAKYSSCGRNLTAGNLNVLRDSFVKFTITLTSDGTTPANYYISELLLFPIDNGPSTSTSNTLSSKQELSRKYYSMTGQEIDKYAKGFVFEKIIYEDGSILTYKTFKK